MPEKADPVSALREAAQAVVDERSRDGSIRSIEFWHTVDNLERALSGEAPDRPSDFIGREAGVPVTDATERGTTGRDPASQGGTPPVAALSGEAPDRDGEVERIATMLRSMPRSFAAALYEAGLRPPSLEGARHPEAGETT